MLQYTFCVIFLMIIGKGTEYSVISLSIYIYIFFFYENDIHKQRQDKKNKNLQSPAAKSI